jgi:hypothetical protein
MLQSSRCAHACSCRTSSRNCSLLAPGCGLFGSRQFRQAATLSAAQRLKPDASTARPLQVIKRPSASAP